MNVSCSTCGELWEISYLQHELIFDTDLPETKAKSWPSLPASQKLSEPFRKELKESGWEFGQTVMNVIRCPCCPEGANPNPRRLQARAALEHDMGDDEIGLATMFYNYKL
jgi:hypothetical protein